MRRRVVVVGAGAFGGWTALMLRRAGAQVTLVDAWGPGHARSSSSGETRVIRGTYGDRAIYTTMAARAMQLWKAHDAQAGRARAPHTPFFHRNGALWMFSGDDAFGRASLEPMQAAGLPVEWLDPAEAKARWPHISFDGVTAVLFEAEAGYALARRACEHVVETFVAEGGGYIVGHVPHVPVEGASLRALTLERGETLQADHFVFACGPWLGSLFPDVVGRRIRASRQESFYFGTPAGDARWLPSHMPVWLDMARRGRQADADDTAQLYYGIPGNAHRGFKVADDTYGPTFDPTHGDRAHTPEMLAEARAFLRLRFPAIADAPLLGSEVCQYELTSDTHFLIDQHPAAANAWLVGGGSGHGFKMGPAIGEYVTRVVLEQAPVDAVFRLVR
ncbi:FAD-dependent oxidoreductase [Luteitalea sp.]|uniref:FAD-dependent oxidoreductase n=1 Tax=Luteitalea sp. TaxID=2004800 RepID=UPI0025BD90E3|nr:FAD-dependent oxidoreductase [Luteitalea sp.]